MNRLRRLQSLGQSVWLDDLGRHYLVDGTLAALIRDDGVSGITSNPAIFERSISKSGVYDQAIKASAENGDSSESLYESLVIEDIKGAADLLRDSWRESGGRDGFVSLEVSPHLADDTAATITYALRLWAAVDRPNIMIKVPGTRAGLTALTSLIAAGINVIVTLLFSPSRYCETVAAFWKGLERRLEEGRPLAGIASVASFFVSRIDVMVDKLLDRQQADSPLRGCAALTAAALAYGHSISLHGQSRWRELETAGARPQRLLWASTSSKDPGYSDVKYVEALIADNTVNTMPLETLQAYRDHGNPAARLPGALRDAELRRQELERAQIDLEKIAVQLEREGIQKFIAPYDSLLHQLESKRRRLTGRHH